MFGRWFISCWGNFGLFSVVFHVSFRECVYLSLGTLENDFASATFFLKNQAVLIFFGCSNTCIGSTAHPVFQWQNEGLHGSATRHVMILVVTVIGLRRRRSNPCVLFRWIFLPAILLLSGFTTPFKEGQSGPHVYVPRKEEMEDLKASVAWWCKLWPNYSLQVQRNLPWK